MRVLQDVESNDFEGIATGDESWFRYCYPPSTMFARAPSEVIPRTQQTIGAKKTMITIFFTARQRILLDVLPKDSKFNQQLHVSGFENRKLEFSSSNAGWNFLGADG
jgi:hypothetical protein